MWLFRHTTRRALCFLAAALSWALGLIVVLHYEPVWITNSSNPGVPEKYIGPVSAKSSLEYTFLSETDRIAGIELWFDNKHLKREDDIYISIRSIDAQTKRPGKVITSAAIPASRVRNKERFLIELPAVKVIPGQFYSLGISTDSSRWLFVGAITRNLSYVGTIDVVAKRSYSSLRTGTYSSSKSAERLYIGGKGLPETLLVLSYRMVHDRSLLEPLAGLGEGRFVMPLSGRLVWLVMMTYTAAVGLLVSWLLFTNDKPGTEDRGSRI